MRPSRSINDEICWRLPCRSFFAAPRGGWPRSVISPAFKIRGELMGYLGFVPSESSTGDKVKRGGITKAGNGRARRILVEAAWSYRYPARVSRKRQPKVAAAPRRVREIAWKAQTRLCGRFRSLLRKGKLPTVAVTAIARELSAFIWAINREVVANRQP